MSDLPPTSDPTADAEPPVATDRLLLVYHELRKLAAAKMAAESADHTLDATALVHEAFLKLGGESFASRSGYLRAAAVAMRRILVDHARAKKADKRGGGRRVKYDLERMAGPERGAEMDALDDALTRLARTQPRVAELVQLRYFAGLSTPDAADLMGISPRTADAWWAYARGWLAEDLQQS